MIADFQVTEYAGTKSILISTRTVLGGKNPFMGIAYVVVGGVCVLLGALFTVAHLVRPRYDAPACQIFYKDCSQLTLDFTESLVTIPTSPGIQTSRVPLSRLGGMIDLDPMLLNWFARRFLFFASSFPSLAFVPTSLPCSHAVNNPLETLRSRCFIGVCSMYLNIEVQPHSFLNSGDITKKLLAEKA